MSGTRLAAGLPGSDTAADTPLRRALRACRKQFMLVGVFSGAVNLLQLTTSLYMMQVFDRVLTTRVLDTLLYLSLLAGAAVLVLATLEAARGPGTPRAPHRGPRRPALPVAAPGRRRARARQAGGRARPDHAARRLLDREPGGAGGFRARHREHAPRPPLPDGGAARPRGLPRRPRLAGRGLPPRRAPGA